MVGERGFEPPTPWSRTRCSTRLSHSPTGPGRKEEISGALELQTVDLNYEIISFASSSTVRSRLRPNSSNANYRSVFFPFGTARGWPSAIRESLAPP
jgi:hypothetical protein